jgi:hypothetical protein
MAWIFDAYWCYLEQLVDVVHPRFPSLDVHQLDQHLMNTLMRGEAASLPFDRIPPPGRRN